MVRIARTRVIDLFGLAEREALRGEFELADRYTRLARAVGARYNVRLLHEFRDLYCRGCSCFWVEGRTVRTRLRARRRVQTCLRCGRIRRTLTARRSAGLVSPPVRRRVGESADPALMSLVSPRRGSETE